VIEKWLAAAASRGVKYFGSIVTACSRRLPGERFSIRSQTGWMPRLATSTPSSRRLSAAAGTATVTRALGSSWVTARSR